jgi:formylglycine-generating enzyme required for sulfatase activity
MLFFFATICSSGFVVAMEKSAPRPKSDGDGVVIPAAISASGAFGTQWESDFRFFNPCFHVVDVHIEFQPDNTDNVGAALASRDLSLSEKTTRYFDNIFDLMPDLGGGEVSGSLRIQSSSVGGCSVAVVSRTFNDTPDGTLGLTVPAMQVQTTNETFLDFPGLIDNDEFRSNLRLVNFSDSTVWVAVTAYDDEGVQIGTEKSAKVFGGSTKQINGVAGWLGETEDLAPFTVRVAANGRAVQAVATVVDNITGDSVLYTSSFAKTSPMWLAGAASLSGVNESQWRTDLWLYNPTEETLECESEFFVGDTPSESYSFGSPDLESLTTQSYLDVVSDELGLEETRGYIVLTGEGGDPVPQVAARTYNLDPVAGTYGLNLRAYRSEDLLYPGESGYVAGVSNSPDVVDFDYGFRTNVGLLNTDTDSWTTVQLTMYDTDGSAAVDTYETTIAPGKMRQFNVFNKLGLGDVEMIGSLRVDVIKGGAVAVYATEIDNRTQDSIFITAQRADFGDDCRYVLDPAFASFEAGGGSGSFEVVTGPECGWEVRSRSSWISTSENTPNVGSATVQYTVHPNSGDEREGSIRAGRSMFRISQEAPPRDIAVSLPGDIPMELVYIPPGTFQMGSPTSERGRASWESQHDVTLTRGYFIGKYEVTQAQWVALMGSNPSVLDGIGDDYPVYYVEWDEIAGPDGFADRLNDYLESTGQSGAGTFRLPTEAEWEMAARGSTQTRFSFGDGLECADDACDSCDLYDQNMWWCGNTNDHAEPVGTKLANDFGLYDMHGNLAEWTQDIWQQDLGTDPQTDPVGTGDDVRKVIKHGSYYNEPRFSRPAYRNGGYPDSSGRTVGFRIARSLASPVKISFCGQTVVTNAVLEKNLVCDSGAFESFAVKVGASNITVDLGGHVISGHPVGIGVTATDVRGVTIKNGTIESFSSGLDIVDSRDVIVEDLTIRNLIEDDPDVFIPGMRINRSQDVLVKDSSFEFLPVAHKEAIILADSEATIDNIDMTGGSVGVNISGDSGQGNYGSNATVINSRFVGVTIGGVLIQFSKGARIADNEFTNNGVGVMVDSHGQGSISGITVEGNSMNGGGLGVHFMGNPDSIIRNNVIRNGWRGIWVDSNMGCPEDAHQPGCFYATGNLISGNVVTGNIIDLHHHPYATGNTWENNTCETKEGVEIPECTAR